MNFKKGCSNESHKPQVFLVWFCLFLAQLESEPIWPQWNKAAEGPACVHGQLHLLSSVGWEGICAPSWANLKGLVSQSGLVLRKEIILQFSL